MSRPLAALCGLREMRVLPALALLPQRSSRAKTCRVMDVEPHPPPRARDTKRGSRLNAIAARLVGSAGGRAGGEDGDEGRRREVVLSLRGGRESSVRGTRQPDNFQHREGPAGLFRREAGATPAIESARVFLASTAPF